MRLQARLYLAVGAILLAGLAGGLAPAAPAPPATPAASRPTPAQIHQAAEAVLSQGKYRRQPNPLQEWLLRRLDQVGQRIGPWLARLFASQGLATGFQIVFYFVAGVVVLAALFLLVRLLLARRRGEAPLALSRPARAGRAASPADLQAQAAALAARGEYGAALRLLQQACLLALDRRGLLVVRTSSTNGEYLRQLRPHPEPRALLAALLAVIEPYLFGGRTLDESQYRAGERSARALLGAASPREGAGAE